MLSGLKDAEFVAEIIDSVGLVDRSGADAVGGDEGLLFDAVADGEGLITPEPGDGELFGTWWALREDEDPFMVANRRRRSSKGAGVLPASLEARGKRAKADIGGRKSDDRREERVDNREERGV